MRSDPEECISLGRQCANSTEIEPLKAAKPSVEYAQGVAGTPAGEVVPFHQCHCKTPKRGIACH